jgi:MinD-like ATPase involved in chromosome partitioning or flagellar assembly
VRTVAFYSYKGGVGRTLLAANIGAHLALLGKRVVLIDLDLEAPGLHYKFNLPADAQPSIGVLGFFQAIRSAKQLSGQTDLEIPASLENNSHYKDLAIQIPTEGTGSLWLIPAGPLSIENYWAKLAEVDLALWGATDPASLADAAKQLVRYCETELGADVVLVDSRTGVTDTNALGLVAMADEVVAVAVPTDEQLDGLLGVLNRLDRKATVVLSRMSPTAETRRSKQLSNREDRALGRIAWEANDPAVYRLTWDRYVELNELVAIASWVRPKDVGELFEDYLALSRGVFPELASDSRNAANLRATELHEQILSGVASPNAEQELLDLMQIHQSTTAANVRALLARLRQNPFEYAEMLRIGMRAGGGIEMTELLPYLRIISTGELRPTDNDGFSEILEWLEFPWIPADLASAVRERIQPK